MHLGSLFCSASLSITSYVWADYSRLDRCLIMLDSAQIPSHEQLMENEREVS